MRIKNNIFDNIINIICLIQLIGITIYLAVAWNSFPEQVPAHFGVGGVVTRYGGRGNLLVGPIVAWLSFGLICIIERFPQIWNTGVRVTQENKYQVYQIIKSLLSVAKLIMVLLLVSITIFQLQAANLPDWFMYLFAPIALVAAGYFMIKLYKSR